MPSDRRPTPAEQLTIDRERARARSEANFEELVSTYPSGHVGRRGEFVRRESEKLQKDIEKRYLDAIPDADRRNQR